MSSRETILGSVRRALQRKPDPPVPPAARIRPAEISDKVTLFRERLEALGGKVYLRNSAQILATVQEIVGSGTTVLSNSEVLAGIEGPRFRDEANLRSACASADFGITSADYALAETGSLVTFASSEARLLSLLPPQHIAIVPVERMLTGLDELFTLHPHPEELASSMVLITGPSRSADIEMILVRGVHGPRVIHVILIIEDA